tara:strand:+ start:313 stop:561 length:249 start_codon:yes stop_codon:yes gene_type:complete
MSNLKIQNSSTKEILTLSKDLCLKIELALNLTPLGKKWIHIGDKLYYFYSPRNNNDKKDLFLVNPEQFNFLKNEYNKLLTPS